MLALRLATRGGRVEVASDDSSTSQLQSLRHRFATSSSSSSNAFQVELDDFLVNVHELTAWPEADTDIRWQAQLLNMVQQNAQDSDVLEERLAAQSGNTHTDPIAHLPKRWEANLNEHQRRDLEKLAELSHGADFSVPGAGKTRVALAAFDLSRVRGRVKRALVICPKSAFESWETEAQTCLEDEPLRITFLGEGMPQQCDLLITNYERLPGAQGSLLHWLAQQPAMMILDEAHRMKLGAAGAWGSACLTLGPYAVQRLILTGTPAPNGASDLESLFGFVWPGQGRNAVTRAIAQRSMREASELLRPLFARTTKDELDLPPVDTAVRRIELPALHRELYDALLGQASSRWATGARDAAELGQILIYLLMAATTPALLAMGASRHEPLPYRVPPLEPPAGSDLATLMRDLPHYEISPKYQEVLGIVKSNADVGRKTLVWSTFVRNLTSLDRLLSAFNPALVHGGTDDRHAEIQRFRRASDCFVLLSNPATLGEGVSLHHECHDAVYVDRDFAAGRYLQSLDRIHRLGLDPEARTQITILVAAETIDELVEQRLKLKLEFMGGILDDPAVLKLGDLDEEPSEAAGMDSADMEAMISYLGGPATS